MAFLFAQLTLLTVWLNLSLLLYGWGSLACRIGRCTRDDLVGWAVNPWIGVGCVVGFLQLWHFALPLSSGALIVFAIVGIVGLVLTGARPWSGLLAALRAQPWLFAVGALFV